MRGPKGDPTPEQILQRAAAVRQGWSDAEYRLRAGTWLDGGGDVYDWHLPVVSIQGEADAES